MKNLSYTLLICALLFVLPFSALGQTKESTQNFTGSINPSASSLFSLGRSGLLNPDRFLMTQSYSMSFISNGKNSFSQGIYLNTMYYRFSRPLSLRLQIGYMHDPSSMFRTSGSLQGRGNIIVPGFELIYQPSKSFIMRLEYNAMPSSLNPYDYFYWLQRGHSKFYSHE